MNYNTTSELLDIIRPFVEDRYILEPQNTTWRLKKYISDLVTIDEENHVGFEVFDNEIIFFYFTEHCHFEDCTSDLEDDEPDYIERAKAFLVDLFSCKITQQKQYKGNTLISEKYIFTYPDGTTDCPDGPWIHGILVRLVPFLPERMEEKSWLFDKNKGCFTEID